MKINAIVEELQISLEYAMEYKELKKQCVKACDDLLRALRSSEVGAELKPEIDKFAVKTNNYLKASERYHERIEKMCGNELLDKEQVNFYLKQFKISLDGAIDIIKPHIMPTPTDFDPRDHKFAEEMKMWKDREKEIIKDSLQTAGANLDLNSGFAFEHAEFIAKENPMGLKPVHYHH